MVLEFRRIRGLYFADLVCAEERAEDAGVDGADGANAAPGDACDAQRLARGTRELCEEGHAEVQRYEYRVVERVESSNFWDDSNMDGVRGPTRVVILWGCYLYYCTTYTRSIKCN